MTTHKELEQKLFDLSQRLDKLEETPRYTTPSAEMKKIATKNNDKYQTNFVKTVNGNGIRTGTELIVKLRGAESVTGKISHNGQLILIDQSHSKDEDNDASTINFKLKHRRFRLFNYNLPLGEYELHIWFWNKDTGERGTYTDKFEIIR